MHLLYNVIVMSNTALTIRTNSETKKAIADFAASLGLSTSAFMTAVTLQAMREQRVVLTPPILEPTPYLEKVMRKADADLKIGRNVSKAYDNVDDFFKDLDKEV
jgi:antitoxin component of RelBE/YafQ-DinJ toxin-antitoxin module